MRTPPVFASALLLAAVCGASACGPTREQRARAAQEDQVRDLARQAAELAGADSGAAARTAAGRARRSPVERATIPNRLAPPGDLVGDSGGAAAAAPGELRIVSTDGAVVYTLARDTVRMQLGDSVLREMRRHMDVKAESSSSNFGNLIARTVAGAVGSAMGFVVRTPVRDIHSVGYHDGDLKIETGSGVFNNASVSVGKNGKKGEKGDRTVFTPADAERFVAAVEARRRALGVR